jgi:nucleotide-binding universal stress UspA family protein
MSGSIICGVDGTRSAEKAVNVARQLSDQLGLRLLFVQVVDAGTSEGTTATVAERLAELSENDGWLVDVGHPADRLVAVAKDEEAQLMVVGSHGPRSSLLGSISADVSRRASCPVVVVPPDADGWEFDSEKASVRRDQDFAGGIVRLGLGSGKGDSDSAGGILRFNLGGREN